MSGPLPKGIGMEITGMRWPNSLSLCWAAGIGMGMGWDRMGTEMGMGMGMEMGTFLSFPAQPCTQLQLSR